MKTLLLSAVAAAAVAAMAPAAAQTAAPQASPAAKKPVAAKPVTRADVTQRVQQHFARLDANKDGAVTKAEADAAAANVRQRFVERADKRSSAMFDRLDTNKDGIVSKAEAEPIFAQRKAAAAQATPGRERGNWDAMAARFDTNEDGSISRAEFDSGRAAVRQRVQARTGNAGVRHAGFGGRMFEAADANKDGRVTIAEATAAAAAHFDTADTNRDGQVTPDEMRQARQKMRPNAARR